jgi:putative SOS response-associated peptidase YedK
MCGRYTLIRLADFTDMFPWIRAPVQWPGARYNIAPSQPIAVVSNDGPPQVQFFRWGLVPSWAKDAAIGNRMINARSETLAAKPMFRTALKRRRCLIPADGFYEWKRLPDGKTKVPMHIRLKGGKPFAFAGLWDRWTAPDGSELPTCTIITGKPNELVRSIHDRMPVILTGQACRDWIAPGEISSESAAELLKPYPPDEMEAQPVSRKVNNPAFDSAECIESMTEESAAVDTMPARKKKVPSTDSQGSLF